MTLFSNTYGPEMWRLNPLHAGNNVNEIEFVNETFDDEILSRIMVALANEGANVLDEHIAIRPGDIDVIYAYGFGYPRHRGGPMAYADSLGLPHVLAKVNEYRARFGDHWQPAPLLERLAASGKGFYDVSTAASAA